MGLSPRAAASGLEARLAGNASASRLFPARKASVWARCFLPSSAAASGHANSGDGVPRDQVVLGQTASCTFEPTIPVPLPLVARLMAYSRDCSLCICLCRTSISWRPAPTCRSRPFLPGHRGAGAARAGRGAVAAAAGAEGHPAACGLWRQHRHRQAAGRLFGPMASSSPGPPRRRGQRGRGRLAGAGHQGQQPHDDDGSQQRAGGEPGANWLASKGLWSPGSGPSATCRDRHAGGPAEETGNGARPVSDNPNSRRPRHKQSHNPPKWQSWPALPRMSSRPALPSPSGARTVAAEPRTYSPSSAPARSRSSGRSSKTRSMEPTTKKGTELDR